MQSVKQSDIASYFAQRALAPIKQSAKRESKKAEDETGQVAVDVRQVELTAHHRFTRPLRVIFSQDDSVEVSTWKGVAREILKRVIAAGQTPPTPFRIGRSKGFFLADSQESMREGQQLDAYWFESHFSADDLIRNTVAACEAGGYSWKNVRVDITQSGRI
jgi:hypothetical protein